MRLITIRGEDRERLSVAPEDAVRTAMKRMNETGHTLLLVVDVGRLAGVVADGDIRRFLANGGTPDDRVEAAANAEPTTMAHDTKLTEVRALMDRRGLEYLPLVDGSKPESLCILTRAPLTTDLSAVIMAGGVGSRLAPLTDDCPKPLLRLGDKPILSHVVDHLRDQGIHRFVFTVNYLSHLIVDHYGNGSRWDCFIDYIHESEQLGTGGSLALLDLDALSDPFLCMNADILSDIDVGALHDVHVERGWDATMVVHEHGYTVPYGVVEATGDGEFAHVREKPVMSFRINAGAYMLSKSALAVVPEEGSYDMTSLFTDLVATGLRGGTYAHNGRWIDIGTSSEYERARAIYEERQHP